MRLRCPRCATIVEGQPGTQLVCSGCGYTAMAPGAAAAPKQAPQPGMSPPLSTPIPAMSPPGQGIAPPTLLNPNHGPLGKRRWPGTPILLGLATFFVYTFVWHWKVSKEMDAFMVRPGHSHSRVRLGIFLVLASILVLAIAIFSVVAVMVPQLMEDPNAEPTIEDGPALALLLAMLLGFGLFLAGFVVLAMGLWRLWKLMEAEDQRRLVQNPFNATAVLVLYVLMVVPYGVGLLCFFAALAMTQIGLNRIWAAYNTAHPALPPNVEATVPG